MATSNTFSIMFNSLLNKPWKRFVILVVAGGAGALLVIFCREWIFCFLGVTGRAKDYLILPMLSFFVFIALWAFRTYDTRQQIQQANFVKGLDNLVSNNPLQVDVGVILLLEVSKATSAFDKEIRLAFIKRLKELPGDLNGRKVMDMRAKRLSYAQYIIQWLINHPKSGDPFDLSGMDCRYQEFTSRGDSGRTNRRLEIATILTSPSGKPDDVRPVPDVTFEEAFCENISFEGVNVSKYNFTNAEEVDITGAYINPLIVRGLDPNEILRVKPDTQNATVMENPDWPKPKPLANECIHVWQKCKTDSPK